MASDVATIRVESPSHQAFQLLHVAFTVAPLVAGIDKFFHFLVDWDQYVAPAVAHMLGGIGVHTFMMAAGVVEVIAGLLVAIAPRIGGWVVGLWLCGIIVNLLLSGAYYDVALRDLGLALGAFALARLSMDYA